MHEFPVYLSPAASQFLRVGAQRVRRPGLSLAEAAVGRLGAVWSVSGLV